MEKTISEAVTQRRTAKRSSDKEVPIELIYELLDKARFAPFHKREPWQAKIVTTEEEKEFLYQKVIARFEENGTIHDEESRQKFEAKMDKNIRKAPVIILFAREIISDNKRLNSDAIQATAAMIQNFSLLAYEAGLVGFWASSAFVMDQAFSTSIGFDENMELIANYRLGYPEADGRRSNSKRKDVKSWAQPLLPLE